MVPCGTSQNAGRIGERGGDAGRRHLGVNIMRRSFYLMLTAGISLAAFAAPAAAQTSDVIPSAEQDAKSEGDIVVTANKRSERLRDVPAAVSAISGESLVRTGATRLQDYVTRVPGLILDDTSFANGGNQLTIRGLNTGTGGNPTVGIYVDDLPYGGSNSSSFGGSTVPDLDPLDLERVEVLRGPQGTLYGAGSLGGLFKYVTAAPDPSATFGRVQADGQFVDGGGSGFGLRGAGNVPLAETLALRASGFYREDPGFVDNITTGESNINRSRIYGGRGALGWTPAAGWSVRASASLQKQQSDGNAVEDHFVTGFKSRYGKLEQARAPDTGKTETFVSAYALTIQGDLGFATLTSATGYNHQDLDFNLDVTAAYGAILGANGIPGAGVAIITDAGLNKFTQELRLASSGSGPLSWQVGAFYTHEKARTHQFFSAFLAATGAPYPVTLPTLLDAHVRSTFEEIAGFGTVTYAFSPAFDVTAGLRYSHNQQRQRQTNDGIFIGTDAIDTTSEDDSVTYLVNPRLRLGADTMVYARFATGYRPGGPNNPVPGTPASYGPDRTTNYEVGVKTGLADGLTLDLAAYWIDWSDIQLNQRSPAGLNYNGNGGSATSKGVEASLSWRPVAGLIVDGNVSYSDAVLAEDLPAGNAVAAKGARLPSVPKWTLQANADYEFPLSTDLRGTIGGGVRFIDDRLGYFDGAAVPRYQLPSYTVADLRAGVRFDDFSLDLFLKNVGDAHGQVAAYTLGPDARVSVIQPRTLGVSLASRF